MPRKRRAFFYRGIHAPPVSVKAHTVPRVGTQAGSLVSATLHHEFFNALLFSRNVRRLKLLLIELLYD